MKFLLKIEDKDFGLEKKKDLKLGENLRKSARAVVLNNKNQIALQLISRDGYYKLPGGGIEPGESIKEGLRREILEEVGCEIDILNELGFIIEYKVKKNLLQISYCYLVKVKGEIGNPTYDKYEVEEGMKSLWVSLDKAIDLISSKTDNYSGKFITLRDLNILLEAKHLLTI